MHLHKKYVMVCMNVYYNICYTRNTGAMVMSALGLNSLTETPINMPGYHSNGVHTAELCQHTL